MQKHWQVLEVSLSTLERGLRCRGMTERTSISRAEASRPRCTSLDAVTLVIVAIRYYIYQDQMTLELR